MSRLALFAASTFLSIGLASAPSLSTAGGIGLFRVTGSTGNQPSSQMQEPALHDGALLIAYATQSRNLGQDHGTGSSQIFVQDAVTDAVQVVSIGSTGQFANGNSYGPAFSGNARYLSFITNGNNLVPGPSPGVFALYRRDLQNGITERVSNGLGGVINGQARYPTLSHDGRHVAYYTQASNQVVGDTNGLPDLVLTDMQTGITERLSVGPNGEQSSLGAVEHWMPHLSSDARFAVFASGGNLVPGTGGGVVHVYLRDRVLQTTQLLSRTPAGLIGNGQSSEPAMSRNGRFVAFRTSADNLVGGTHSGLLRLDRSSGQLSAVPLPPNAFSCSVPGVSNRGDVTFLCSDTVAGGRQVWLFQPPSSLFLLSPGMQGGGSNGIAAGQHAIGENGVLMAYSTSATDIVAGDTNSAPDIYVAVDLGRLLQLFSDGFE